MFTLGWQADLVGWRPGRALLARKLMPTLVHTLTLYLEVYRLGWLADLAGWWVGGTLLATKLISNTSASPGLISRSLHARLVGRTGRLVGVPALPREFCVDFESRSLFFVFLLVCLCSVGGYFLPGSLDVLTGKAVRHRMSFNGARGFSKRFSLEATGAESVCFLHDASARLDRTWMWRCMCPCLPSDCLRVGYAAVSWANQSFPPICRPHFCHSPPTETKQEYHESFELR